MGNRSWDHLIFDMSDVSILLISVLCETHPSARLSQPTSHHTRGDVLCTKSSCSPSPLCSSGLCARERGSRGVWLSHARASGAHSPAELSRSVRPAVFWREWRGSLGAFGQPQAVKEPLLLKCMLEPRERFPYCCLFTIPYFLLPIAYLELKNKTSLLRRPSLPPRLVRRGGERFAERWRVRRRCLRTHRICANVGTRQKAYVCKQD